MELHSTMYCTYSIYFYFIIFNFFHSNVCLGSVGTVWMLYELSQRAILRSVCQCERWILLAHPWY